MSQENKKLKVAYVTTCFCSISHTFIRREVQALMDSGVEVGLFGVRPDRSSKIVFYKCKYLYPVEISSLIIAFMKLICKRPLGLSIALSRALFNEELNPYQHFKLIYHFFLSLKHSVDIIENRYDHIHAHFINVPTTIAMYCSITTGIPFSFTCHSAGEVGLKEVIAIKSKFKKASFVRVISAYLLKDLASFLKFNKSVHVVRCGLDFSKYALKTDFSSHSPFRIVAVGRLVEKKGFRYLLDAINNLKTCNVNVVLNLIGNGLLLEELKEIANKHGIASNVNFLLEKSPEEVEDILKHSDLLVVPSVTSVTGEQEGLPTIIVEGMRACLPVIATHHSGIPELVINNQTGVLVNEANYAQLAEKINIMINDVNLRTNLALKAFENAQKMYDQKNITKELIMLYSKDYAN